MELSCQLLGKARGKNLRCLLNSRLFGLHHPTPLRAGLNLLLERKSLGPAGNETSDLPTRNLDVTRLKKSNPVFVLEIKMAVVT